MVRITPRPLHNNYIFTDFNDGEIFSVDINNDQTLNYLFDQPNSGFGPVQFVTGPDGYIYTVDLIGSSINRLLISELPAPAVILTVDPGAGSETAGTQVALTATASAAVSGDQSVDLSLGGAGSRRGGLPRAGAVGSDDPRPGDERERDADGGRRRGGRGDGDGGFHDRQPHGGPGAGSVDHGGASRSRTMTRWTRGP